MAIFDGTNGDDMLTGTSAVNTFNPLLGNDSVDGMDGIDTLNVDYSSLLQSAHQTVIFFNGTSYYGTLYSGAASVSFSNIEKINYKASLGDDFLYVSPSPAVSGGALSLNGGAGNDTLMIESSYYANTTFNVSAGGNVTSNLGTFSNWENYILYLGNGTNTVTTTGGMDEITGGTGTETISTGAGNDRILSFGVDTVDGGANNDIWIGQYSTATTDLTFSMVGTTGTLSNGTTLANIERVQFSAGSGNDTFSTDGRSGWYQEYYGGEGVDTFNFNAAGTAQNYYYPSSVSSAGTGGFHGYLSNSSGYFTTFYYMEKVDLTLGDDDNYISVDTAPLSIAGTTLSIDGGLGADTLAVNFTSFADTSFVVDANGAITSNHGNYSNFENFTLTLGNGVNTVTTAGSPDNIIGGAGTETITTGTGNDTITSYGVDTVDGGADYDSWIGAYSAATTNLTFEVAGTSATLSNGTTLANIEGVQFRGGAGNDTISTDACSGGYQIYYGGGGVDSFTFNASATSQNYYYNNSIFSDGAGGFTGYLSSTTGYSTLFQNMEKVSLSLGDDSNSISVDTASLATAGNTLSIDGGLGNDMLAVNFTSFANTSFIVAANGATTSNHGSYLNFENFNLTLGDGTNTVTTIDGVDNIIGGAGTETIDTGAGNDTINSHGVDTVDGGADYDSWIGNYGSATTNLTFAMTGNSGTLSNGTTLANIESVQFTAGSGDDTISTDARSGGYQNYFGGDGVDTFTFNATSITLRPYDNSISSDGAGGFSGNLSADLFYYTSFQNMEQVSLTFAGDDNYVRVDTASLATAGSTLSIDGGLGNDRLIATFASFANTSFTVTANGMITSNHGSYSNFENFSLTLGDGTNTVITADGVDTIAGGFGTETINTGGGSDTITSYGVDTIDGGADYDSWYGNYTDTTTALNFVVTGTSAILSNGTTLANIEGINLYSGSADDTISTDIRSGGCQYYNGGDGFDSFTATAANTSYNYNNTSVSADGIGGYNGYLYSFDGYYTEFFGMEKVALTLDDGDNMFFVTVDASSLVAGASLTVSGGLGNDTIRFQGLHAGYSITQDGAGGYTVVDTDLSDGNQGTTHVSQFETAQFDDTSIDLPTYGNGVTLTGTPGNDSLTGTAFDDILSGLGGNDTLKGLGGNDLLKGGAGTDILDGGSGVDTVSYADATGAVKVSLAIAVAQTISAGEGKDTLIGIENLIGSAFSDTLTGNTGDNWIEGGAGNDKIDGGYGADTMIGGKGSDTYYVDNGGDVVIETGANAAIDGKDSVFASTTFTLGDNIEKLTLSGGAAIDGTGNVLANTIVGNASDNVISGLGGNDVLSGLAGHDTLWGGEGDDKLDGGTGDDFMSGGNGNDTYVVDSSADIVIEYFGGGTDLVSSSASFTLGSYVENLTLSGAFAINGTGNELANKITGNIGDNVLSGGAGKDVLSGGSGNDHLIGGAGADALNGGLGNDAFVFDSFTTTADRDTIKDFTTGQDHFEIARSAFAAFAGDALGELSASEFVIGTKALTASQHLIYDTGHGALYYDADGVGGAAQVTIAVLANHASLTAQDFMLI